MKDWKAVIFDMDGVMVDTEPLARRAWDHAMAEWDLVIPDSTYQKLLGRTLVDTGKILLEDLGTNLPFEQVARRKLEYVEEEIARNGISLKPGLLCLLDWLEDRQIAKAVASSSVRQTVLHKLSLTGVLSRFETIVGGDEITQGKPAPDIFLAAARHLSIPPAECVVLEDSEPGIRAAHAAGMIPIMVPDQLQPSPVVAALAFRVVPSLFEVKSLLDAG